MQTAVFKSYENGYYTFLFNNGSEIMFDDALPKVLAQYDLINDNSLLDTEFHITFSEKQDRYDQDLVVYTIMSLKPLNK